MSGGGARAGGRRAQRGDCAAVLAGRARRTTLFAPSTHSVRSVRCVQTMRGESEVGSAPLRYAPPVPLRSSPPARRPRPTPHALPGGSGDRGAQGRQGWRRSSLLAPSWWQANGAGQGLVKERRREKGVGRRARRAGPNGPRSQAPHTTLPSCSARLTDRHHPDPLALNLTVTRARGEGVGCRVGAPGGRRGAQRDGRRAQRASTL